MVDAEERICTKESLDVCPKCRMKAFELVDVSYDLQIEFEEGYPTKVELWICNHCGFEESQRSFE